jgi:glycosyltransferase involved in cell wall biosynthesis
MPHAWNSIPNTANSTLFADTVNETAVRTGIAAIVPCYKVRRHILPLLGAFGPEVERIYVVDDCCPEGSGKLVQESVVDPRVSVIFLPENLGVGGAVKRGFAEALREGYSYLVKVDGDGQMDPRMISRLTRPIQDGLADYTKGNRFFNPRFLSGMPAVRLVGNGILSFLTKISSGYWTVMDPSNGFLAIHAKVFAALESSKIDDRYFFETDMLCRLHLVAAVVQDVPFPAKYEDERSNLGIGRVALSFPFKHLSRFWRRIVYDYFVHDFNVGSLQLVFGFIGLLFGVSFGGYHWVRGWITGAATETGTIMVATLSTILGFQLLLSALHYDISNRNTSPIHRYL